jgi:predicted small metal-binding protein
MRVIECDECGETLTAASDAELVEVLGDHLESEHGIAPDAEELSELVESEVYEATDS